jgi:ABC-type branched-subunit amino acid transport system substrate-binding protein
MGRLAHPSRLVSLSRTSPLLRAVTLLSGLALSACVNQPGVAGYGVAANPAPAPVSISGKPAPPPPGRRVGILLPLSGPNAEVGQSLLKAAQLSLTQPGSPPLDPQDTAGTPGGAAAGATRAIAAGDGIILGPLTNSDTAAAAPITREAHVPLLAFTSDSTQGQPGVWPLGITPAQQVRRLVLAVQAEGKTRIAAVVPQNLFGEALANGLLAAAREANLPEPKIVRTPYTFGGFNDALKAVSDYAGRRGSIEAQQRAARASGEPDARKRATEIGQQPVPPPPMDALFIGVTGDLLGQVVPLLAFYDVTPNQVRVLGPATWTRDAQRLPGLAGAWFAAPDPAARAGFDALYQKTYTTPARDFTSLAYDAAGIARAVATPNGFSTTALTKPEGFAGADGLIGLLPDGTVRRGLAIFEVDRGGAHIVQPAPQTLAAPGV